MSTWAPITATEIHDAAGNLMPSGVITFTPTDAGSRPLAFHAATGGLTVPTPASTTITNGVVQSGFHVASSASSNPNPYYTVTVMDSNTGTVITLTGVVVPDAGLNLDSYIPAGPSIPSGSGGNWSFNEIPSGTINGTNTTFTLAHTPVAGTLMLFLNGVLVMQNADYSLSGNTVTFSTATGFYGAPKPGDTVISLYRF